MNRLFLTGSLFFLLLAVSGCASVTMVDSWRSVSAPASKYSTFLVVGITDNAQNRQLFEGIMAAELRKAGLAAVPSYTVTGVETVLSVALIEQAARSKKCDAVITSRLVDVKSKTRRDVGYEMTSRGIDSYASWYGTGTVSYATFDLKPVEITTSKTYAIETNLFDVSSTYLTWTGTTNAVDPKGLITGSEKYAVTVINKMKEEGLIP